MSSGAVIFAVASLFKVLPLRMTTAEVAALDEVWRRLGFKSRTAMIIDAVSHPVLRKVVRAATGIDDVLSASAFADALLQLQREL